MSNRLSESNSPYLLQHKDNPVDWFPWGEEALKKARQEDKPIFLSIGYAACHWCHVMAHESFEDEPTATIMNEHFVNIKVDREERPDIDNIYMNSVVALTGNGGWPMSVFLTPDGKPFYGGTYFPPLPRYNIPSFKDVLLSIANAWKEDRANVDRISEKLTENMKTLTVSPQGDAVLEPENLDQAAMSLAQNYDWQHGGWGKAPKFPQPMAIEFLLRRSTRKDQFGLEMALHALDSMSRGGMYDVVGGGFARYSTDDAWLVPHFEKMLYDNALLARVYLHAYLITRNPKYRRICDETLEFLIREMTHHDGGFFSSIDADSGGGEGRYYLWSWRDLRSVLAEADDFELITEVYGVNEKGNFEGSNILRMGKDEQKIADQLGIDLEEFRSRLNRIHATLLKEREKREKPGIDDKVLVSWNALMSLVFSEGARYLGNDRYLEMATRNSRFILDNLIIDGQLFRSWRNGKVSHYAYLEDYAAFILALLSLYQSDPDPIWFETAEHLASQMIDHFHDPSGGFYDTSDLQEQLIVRPKDIQDNAIPSGNSMAATALLYLYTYTNREKYLEIGEGTLRLAKEVSIRYPIGFSQWLCAIDFALNPRLEVALLGDSSEIQMQNLIEVLWSEFRPSLVAAISSLPISPSSPPLLHGRGLLNDLPTAYVCQSFFCKRPVNDPEEFSSQLEISG